MPEPLRIGGNLRAAEECRDTVQIGRRHLLLYTIRAEACDLAADKDVGLVDRVSEVMAGITADDQGSRLPHEGAHMADRAADHDGHTLHRDTAAPGCGGRLRGIAAHPD